MSILSRIQSTTEEIINLGASNGRIHLILIALAFSGQAWGAEISINDPATDGGYVVTSYVASSTVNPDISIIGVYETRSDPSFG